jgi:hypothetical protein
MRVPPARWNEARGPDGGLITVFSNCFTASKRSKVPRLRFCGA